MLRIMDVPCSNNTQIEKIPMTESENPALEISPTLKELRLERVTKPSWVNFIICKRRELS